MAKKKHEYSVQGTVTCRFRDTKYFKKRELTSQLRTVFVTATTKTGAIRKAKKLHVTEGGRRPRSCTWRIWAVEL